MYKYVSEKNVFKCKFFLSVLNFGGVFESLKLLHKIKLVAASFKL